MSIGCYDMGDEVFVSGYDDIDYEMSVTDYKGFC